MRPQDWIKIKSKRLTKAIVRQLFRIGLQNLANALKDRMFTEDESSREISRDTLLKGPTALKRHLNLDEETFLRVDGPFQRDARAYYCYGVADEILKAGVAAIHWEELLEGPNPDPATTSHDKNITRVVVERVRAEQEMWIRKLTEHLINLICLSNNNKEPVFRALLAAQCLDDHAGLDLDFQEFFACRNENNRYSINMYAKIIAEIQTKENLRPLPLFAAAINPDRLPHPGKLLLSVRARFKKALTLATLEEKIALRLSYASGFSESSRTIHATIQDRPAQQSDLEEIAGRLGEVGLLAAHILSRVFSLCAIQPAGFTKQLLDAISHPQSIAPALIATAEREFFAGDLGLLTGEVVQVIKTSKSTFGYTSVRVRYLSRSPLPGILEDEFPAKYFSPIVAAKDVRAFMLKQIPRMPVDVREIVRESLKNASDEKMLEAAKNALLEMHKSGVFAKMFAAQKKRGRG